MKNNNSYSVNDEIDLGALIRSLWKEKILILFTSTICALLSHLYYGTAQQQDFRTEITLKNPPSQLFDSYNFKLETSSSYSFKFDLNKEGGNNNNNDSNNYNVQLGQFVYDFNLNFLSLDNIESFLAQSKEFDNFKAFLKSRNSTAQEYFKNKKFGQIEEKNKIILNKYFLVTPKELDGVIFFNSYAEFIKKKTIIEFKENLKLKIQNSINVHNQALEIAKKINLENPIIISIDKANSVVSEPEALFYKGYKVITQQIVHLNQLIIKLENDQFNYNHVVDKAILSNISKSSPFYLIVGLMSGILLSFVIIFFKSALKEK
jgi:LPS O-antigen subunit length determinant protein (WzzB/FepE family)